MMATPPLMSREPTRSASRPENGEVTTKAAAEGVKATPAATGPSVPALSYVSGSRNSMPYMPKVMPAVAVTAPRQCLDWTERTHHLAEPLGAAFLNRLCEAGWLRRSRRSRLIDVTPKGQLELKHELDLEARPDAL